MSDNPTPIQLDYVERKIVYSVSIPASKRYVMFSILIETERAIWMEYALTRWSDRKMTYSPPFVINERTVFVPPRIITIATSRTIQSPPADACVYERYCTFVPGAQILTWTTSIVLPFEFASDRKMYACQDPISLRTISMVLEVPEERLVWAQCVGDSRVYTSLAHLTISSRSERVVYVEVLDKMSQRQMALCLEVPDERLISLQIQRLVQLHTPLARMGLARLGTQRWCVVGSDDAYTERMLMFFLHRVTDRLVSLSFTGWDDRLIMYTATQYSCVHSFYVAMARPTPTERMIVYVPIVYMTERKGWVETRDLYDVKLPSITTDNRVLRSTKDELTQLAIKMTRDVELSNLTVQKTSQIDKSAVSIGSSNNIVQVSMVDNLGASVTQNPNNVIQKTLLTTGSVRLNLTASPTICNKIIFSTSYQQYPPYPNNGIVFPPGIDPDLDRCIVLQTCSGLTDRLGFWTAYSEMSEKEIFLECARISNRRFIWITSQEISEREIYIEVDTV